MHHHNRREFLADVGRGMLVTSVGAATALELGLAPAWAADEAKQRVTFGKLEPLVTLMQETAPEKLLPALTARLKSGTSLNTLVSAGALANVRAFAGQDYTGYHTFMALIPALHMASELPAQRQALPVLKVLYRNTSRIQHQGAQKKDALQHVEPAKQVGGGDAPIRDAVRAVDWHKAESQFAALARGPAGEAFNHLQYEIQDEVDVHRVVLSWRAWSMLDIAGLEYSHTLLRQSVRYCLDVEQRMRERKYSGSPIRKLLPTLLDEHKLIGRASGTRKADDAWVDDLANTIYSSQRASAASAVAAALAEGFDPEVVGEAISLAANRLVLHDPGRLEKYSSPQKPAGCVHGDSVGVHASDAANAWRNISRVSNARNKVASLIVGAFHTAGQTRLTTKEPYPYTEELAKLKTKDAKALLGHAEEAIRSNDQALACAVIERYGQLKLPSRPVFDLLLKYAVSEDGALHAEKYYRTVSEEYSTTRPAYRWRQLVALARVTASEHGFPAPGHQQACDLLGVS